MADTDGIWSTSVSELLNIFRDGLVGMISIAERAHMKWREPNAYDDWDQIATAIYSSIVVESIKHSKNAKITNDIIDYDKRIVDYTNIIDYDKRIVDYTNYAYISNALSSMEAFISLTRIMHMGADDMGAIWFSRRLS